MGLITSPSGVRFDGPDSSAQQLGRLSRLSEHAALARADHDTRERERAELVALELRNEMSRYEIECQ